MKFEQLGSGKQWVNRVSTRLPNLQIDFLVLVKVNRGQIYIHLQFNVAWDNW